MRTPLTAKDLRALGACRSQADTFARVFPGGLLPTVANVHKCLNVRLDVNWLALQLAPAPLYADYEAKRDTLCADYEAKRAPLDAAILTACWPD